MFANDIGMVFTRVARVLVSSAALAGTIGAQSSSSTCSRGLQPSQRISGWIVDPRGVAWTHEGIVVFADRLYHVVDTTQGRLVVDSSAAALMVGRAGALLAIGQPRPESRLRQAHAIPLADGDVRVVFASGPNGMEEDAPNAPYWLWTARLRNGKWQALQRIGEFVDRSGIDESFNRGLVEHEGALYLAIASSRDRMVSVVRLRGDSVSVRQYAVPLAGVDHANLASRGRDLWLSFRANEPGRQGFADIWVTRVHPDSLSGLRRITKAGENFLDQPMLVPTDSAMLLAWLDEGGRQDAASLVWLAVDRSNASEHRLAVEFPVYRGAPPFSHLITARLGNGRDVVLALSADGVRRVADVEALGLATLVVGRADSLRAVSLVRPVGEPRSAELGIFDITCGAARERVPPRP